ncbi:lipopolysaccharide biosynthesis protein [Joostella sp.]|uniref:lipopolysaccharide biosynthesis protein n=1 Tax=Joostella sp. TaxID=2231138 RepID=UPI003A920427
MNNKSLIRGISFFTFFNVINSSLPFLLLPILTSYLSPEDYGVVDIFYNTSLIITPIIGLSIVQSIGRYYFEKIDLPKFITTIFFILIVTGLLISIISLFFNFLFNAYLLKHDIPPYLIFLAFIYTLFTQIGEILLVLWRVSYKTMNYGLFRLSKTALDLGISILLIVQINMGWEGRIFSQLFVAVLFAIIAIVLLYKKKYLIGFIIDEEYRNEALSFSIPLVFHSLGGYIISFSDRFFILLMLGISDVGIYSVAYQIGMIISLIQNSFNQAWVPFFFKKLKDGNSKDKYQIVKITYFYCVILILISIIIYFIVPVIYKYFIGEAYTSGSAIVTWVLLGYLFNGMYKMMGNYLFFLKKTRVIATITLVAGIINMCLNYYLISLYGIVGAAQATAITFLFHFIFITYYSVKKYEMPWNLK